MNKSDTIIQITSDVLNRYRSSIPRKAFIRAMEQVIELVLDSATAQTRPASPGLALIRSSDMDVENLAQLLCGACPPFRSAAPVRPSRPSFGMAPAMNAPVRSAGNPG